MMKNIIKIALMLFAVVAFTACNNAPKKATKEEAPTAEVIESTVTEPVVEVDSKGDTAVVGEVSETEEVEEVAPEAKKETAEKEEASKKKETK